jgi:hypothetical protein
MCFHWSDFTNHFRHLQPFSAIENDIEEFGVFHDDIATLIGGQYVPDFSCCSVVIVVFLEWQPCI